MCESVCVTGGGVNERDSGGSFTPLLRSNVAALIWRQEEPRRGHGGQVKEGAARLEQIVPAAVKSSIRSSDVTHSRCEVLHVMFNYCCVRTTSTAGNVTLNSFIFFNK